jgi:hypothetical protein
MPTLVADIHIFFAQDGRDELGERGPSRGESHSLRGPTILLLPVQHVPHDALIREGRWRKEEDVVCLFTPVVRHCFSLTKARLVSDRSRVLHHSILARLTSATGHAETNSRRAHRAIESAAPR